MAKYQSLAALLKSQFPGLSQRKIAERLGVEHTSVARWFASRGGTPTMDSCLRIARACKIDPCEVFVLAGVNGPVFQDLYEFFQGRPSRLADLYADEPALASLADRSERLFRRGMQADIDAALLRLEMAWEVRRADFELVLREAGAKAGCLLVDHAGMRGDLFYQLNCRDSEIVRLSGLARGARLPRDWRLYVHDEYEIRLRLFLRKGARLSTAKINSTLHLWSFGFSRLLKTP